MLRIGSAVSAILALPLALLAQPGGVSGSKPPVAPTRPALTGADKPGAGSPTRPVSGPQPTAAGPSTGGAASGKDAGPKDPIVDEAIELFKKGEIQKSVEKLTEAAQKNPALPPAKIMLARMYGNAGQAQLARVALEQAAVENPDHPDVYITFGQAAVLDNRLLDAELQFREGLKTIDRGSWSAEQKKNIKLNCLSGLAMVAERRARWDKAKELLDEILSIEPKNGNERNRLGRALFMLEKRDAAADELEKAAKDEPKLQPYPISMAQLYLSIRNKPKAEEWFNFGLKADPKSAKIKQAFASFLMNENRLDEADKQVKELLSDDPKNLELRFLAAQLARLKKDSPGAERVLEGLLVEKPDALDVKNQLALVLISTGDDQKKRRALEMAEANLKVQPNNAELAATFAWALFKVNRVDDAERLFANIYRQNAGLTSDTAYYMANVLADKGKLDDAKRLLRSALDSEGLFFNRSEAKDWLNTLEGKK